MEMDTKAVVAWYRQAKPDRRKAMIDQIAKANEVPAAEIVKILQEAGEIGKPGRKKKVETPEDNMMRPETPEAAIKEAVQPRVAETPEAPRVKADRAVMLEDVLDIFFGAIEEFREAPEKVDRLGLAKSTLSYMAGVVDTFKAINGPIVR